MKLRIGTRGSDLALWQANTVKGWITSQVPDAEVEIQIIQTKGDQIDHIPLSQVPGKDFFTAEIERALADREVDLAVHSHKDLATENPPGLIVAAIPARAAVAERLLIAKSAVDTSDPWIPLKPGAKVGTSAQRRGALLQMLRPDLEVASLRGNVPTRVRKLREGNYDAIVLAEAGLRRLELDLGDLHDHRLDPEVFIPAPAQGALAIQAREADQEILEVLRHCMHEAATGQTVAAERSILSAAGGGCSLPLGAWIERASDTGSSFRARAFLGAGFPTPQAPARWATSEASSPEAAAEAIIASFKEGQATGQGPLEGLHLALTGSGDSSSPLGAHLQSLGARVSFETVLSFEDLPAPELPERASELRSGDWICVTSRRAARLVCQRLGQILVNTRDAGHDVKWAAVGSATAQILEAEGLTVHAVGNAGGAQLAADLNFHPGSRILFPCAAEPQGELERILTERSGRVVPVPLYRTQASAKAQLQSDVDVRIYMSPSSVQAAEPLESSAPEPNAAGLRLGLGAATCAAMESANWTFENCTGPHGVISFLLRRQHQQLTHPNA